MTNVYDWNVCRSTPFILASIFKKNYNNNKEPSGEDGEDSIWGQSSFLCSRRGNTFSKRVSERRFPQTGPAGKEV